MDEKFLEQYKKIYLKEKVSEETMQKNWDNLSVILPDKKLPVRNPVYRYGLLIAGILILIFIGTVSAAQASRSGELLYPVKILSNNVAAKFFSATKINYKKAEKSAIITPTITPKPTEKETDEDKTGSKQDKNEIKKNAQSTGNESNQDKQIQQNEVKGARTGNPHTTNPPDAEVTQTIKSKDENPRGFDGLRPNEPRQENSQRKKNK